MYVCFESHNYVDKISKEEVLRRISMNRELLHMIKKRHLKFLGHIIRKEVLEELSLAGKFDGKRAQGGQRKQFLSNFEFGSARHLWNLAKDRETWQAMVRQTLHR